MKIIDGYMARKNSSPFLWFSKECVWYVLTLSDSCLAGCCTSIVYLILVLLSLSGPGFFGVPGPGVIIVEILDFYEISPVEIETV